MNLAWLSLSALVVAMIVSCVTELNVGVLGLALAWLVGVYAGGMGLNDVLSGFPTALFLTLAGVTLLFTQAQLNGTLDRVAHAAVRLCRGNVGLMPVMFFVLAGVVASLGPGNVATASMMAPMAILINYFRSVPVPLVYGMVLTDSWYSIARTNSKQNVFLRHYMTMVAVMIREWSPKELLLVW